MPNFDAKVRISYTDMGGLVLDCRYSDLQSIETGQHDGGNNESDLSVSTASWTPGEHIGKVIQNVTDVSYGVITANTATTITAALTGGTDNDWDSNDRFSIMGDQRGVLIWPNRAPAARAAKSYNEGTHDGGDGAATLTDSTKDWEPDSLVGMVVYNLTDESMGWITANTNDDVTATLSDGTDNDWDDGDEYEICDPRFGDPWQNVAEKQPFIHFGAGDPAKLRFLRARESELIIPLDNGFPPTWWTVCIFFIAGTDTSNNQAVLSADFLKIWRKDSGGNYGYEHGAGINNGSGDHPDNIFVLQGIPTNDADYWKDGQVLINGTPVCAAAVSMRGYTFDPGPPLMSFLDMSFTCASERYLLSEGVYPPAIGSDLGGSFMDADLTGLQIWARPLSPLEIDFVYHTVSSSGSLSYYDRAEMELREWTDDCQPNLTEVPRINPGDIAHKFIFANVPYGESARVQIVAEVDGQVRPDSELGGELFSLTVVEIPTTASEPAVRQDAGWSAVFDVVIDTMGHYAFLVSRSNGGGVIVHFDAMKSW